MAVMVMLWWLYGGYSGVVVEVVVVDVVMVW